MPTSNTFTAADLVAHIPEVWTRHVEAAYYNEAVAANFFLDMSDIAAGQGDIFHLADLFTNEFSKSTKSNAAEVTLASPTSVDVTLTVSTWEEVSYLIEDMEIAHIGAEFVPKILDTYSSMAGKVLAQSLEDLLLALWSGLNQTTGSTGAAVTDLQVRQTIRKVDDGPAPRDDRAWFIHPVSFWDQIIGLQKYYDASQTGWINAGAVKTGNFAGQLTKKQGYYGMLYGDPVFVTTRVVSNGLAYRSIYAHKNAFVFATKKLPGAAGRVRLQSNYIPENLGILVTSDHVIGATELRDGFASVLNSSTTATQA